MIFYYIRHGDPIYNPDSLTPLGKRQAEAVAKRFAIHGLDEIYVSTSQRAKETAQPTCEILKMEATELDWANEGHAWEEFSVKRAGLNKWFFHLPSCIKQLNSDEVNALGYRWYEHPYFEDTNIKSGIERIQKESDAFFETLGYRHDRSRHLYIPEKPNDKRIALFAHQAFGVMFLSSLLDLFVPQFVTRFDICHSSVTVIEFADMDGIVIPKVLMLSNDSHIYKENLPTKYDNRIYI